MLDDSSMNMLDWILEHADDDEPVTLEVYGLQKYDLQGYEPIPAFDSSKLTKADLRAAGLDDAAAGKALVRLKLPPFNFYDAVTYSGLPPKQWLIDQICGREDLVLIYGESGVGKTFFVLDLAIRASLGLPVADRFEVYEPLIVVYACAEGVSGLPQRLKIGLHRHGVDHTSNRFIICEGVPQLFLTGQEGKLLQGGIEDFVGRMNTLSHAKLNGEHIDILIIDTYHMATQGADENSNNDARTVLANLAYLRAALQCTVILIHHTAKSGGAERGAGALRGNCDNVIEVKSDRAGKFIVASKVRDDEQWKGVYFDLVKTEVKGRVSASVWWRKSEGFEGGERIQPPPDAAKLDAAIKQAVKANAEAKTPKPKTELAKQVGRDTGVARDMVLQRLGELADQQIIRLVAKGKAQICLPGDDDLFTAFTGNSGEYQ